MNGQDRLFDTSEVESKGSAVREALGRAPHFVWITGPQGAGRGTLARSLRQQLKESVLEIEPPGPREPDTPLHILLQLAGHLGGEAVERACTASISLEERAEELFRLAGKNGHVLFIRLRPSWSLPFNDQEDDSLAERAWSVLSGLRQAPLLRVVVFATRMWQPQHWRFAPAGSTHFELAKPRLRPGSCTPEYWGEYSVAAERVLNIVDSKQLSLAPLQLRFAVALVALGERIPWIAEILSSLSEQESSSLEELANRLVAKLRTPSWNVLRLAAVARAHARFPLKPEENEEISPTPHGHAAFFTRCAWYQTDDGRLRIPGALRRALLADATARHELANSHNANWKHAQVRARADGAASPPTDATRILAWLERAHHLARAGVRGAKEWALLEKPGPELFWDRARALSFEQEYEKAAAVYSECRRLFPLDDYSWHYEAWNRQRDAREKQPDSPFPIEIHRLYAKAAELNRTNVWWHSRRITSLIEDARFREAEDAYRATCKLLDPDGLVAKHDLRLSFSLHRWVVESWLDAGEVERARRAFERIPRHFIDREEELRIIEWRLIDAEEAIALGTSVYSSCVRPEARWKTPSDLPELLDGRRLREWFPGRVLEQDRNDVIVALADPETREISEVTYPASRWRRWLGAGTKLPNGLFFLGVYTAEHQKVVAQPYGTPPWIRGGRKRARNGR